MIEQVVDVRAKFSANALTESEDLTNSGVKAPSSRPAEEIALRDARILKESCTQRWRTERFRIPDSVAALDVRVAGNGGAQSSIEVVCAVEVARGHVARLERTAVIAQPNRRKG